MTKQNRLLTLPDYKHTCPRYTTGDIHSQCLACAYEDGAKAQREMTLREVIEELDECFRLAPHNDSYLRILVKDTLEYFRTGKRRKERQALKQGKLGG